ncbi:MAG: helix-turn-helix domain-containing protein [Desulfobacterales bacterium]|nr:helix-turn-helix domain-containing protein [Desulfobacterales bacterium]
MDIKQITHHIRRLCFEKMMSLAQLAKLTGLTRGCASKIENASKAPPFSTLNKIANALNLDVNMLMAGSSESNENQRLCIVLYCKER